MKKIELFFAGLLVPLDFLMLLLAALTAYFLRFEYFAEFRPIIFDLPFAEYMKTAALVSAGWIVVFALNGLYTIKGPGPRRIIHEFSRIFVACALAMMFVILYAFFIRELFSSRFILLAAWIFSIIFVWLGRLLVKIIRWLLLKKGVGVRKVILVGTGKNAQLITQEINRNSGLGFKIVENIPADPTNLVSRLDEIAKNKEVDDVILADTDFPRAVTQKLVDWAAINHIGFRYAADLFETQAANVEISTITGIPVVEIKKTPLEGWGRIYKRIFDIIGSLVLIILTSPIMLITAIAIKLTSKGPVFWSQLDNGEPVIRVGQNGKPFRYFKFRSMRTGTHSQRYKDLASKDLRKGSPLVKIKDDPRITAVGNVIRRFSIDELPEFFLVLTGKMSLVGPRPHFPEEVAKFSDYQRKTFAIKPGITGLAQISGRSDLDFEDEAKLDAYYMENWSMLMDIAILLKTPLAVFRHREAS